MKLNFKEYWENRSENDWDRSDGEAQTRGFARILIDHLPYVVLAYIEGNNASILDWGCAEGQGVEELARRFPSSGVTGLDFSEAAIENCRRLYPEYNFRKEPLDAKKDMYDVIINNNCLEHFTDYIGILSSHMMCAGRYYVIMVPYKEERPSPGHKAVMTGDSFPQRLGAFYKLVEKVIDTRNKGCWDGSQLLVVYERRSYLR